MSILAIVVAVGGAFGVGAFHVFEHTFAITGQFSDAAGVSKGAPVRLAGVQVGTRHLGEPPTAATDAS